jgi:hypothetical protein
MTPNEVFAIMGPPPNGIYPAGGGTLTIIWNYSNDSPLDGGVRLFVEFEADRVTRVRSWVRTFYRDMVYDTVRPTVFRLHPDGTREEGAEFKRLYCPD